MRNLLRTFTPRLRHLVTDETGGIAMELLVGFVTAPDTTQTALTMSAGNTLTIRNSAIDSPIKLLATWVDAQLRGILRIRSPKMKDGVQGLRFDTIASQPQPLIDPMFPQRLYSQDTLSVDLSGSATAGDIETAALLVHYPDQPGVSARLHTAAEVKQRFTGNLFTVENSIATGTGGGFTGEEALNADFDLMPNNTDFALLGYLVSPVAGQTVGECAAVRWRGVDTGNLGVGGPGMEDMRHLTSKWFVYLSERSGLATIPVFNSSNVGGILVDVAQDENGVDVLVTSIFGELR